MSQQRNLRSEVTAWVEPEILNCILSVCEAGPAGVKCLRAVADELRQPDPRWDAIREAIRGAQRAVPHSFRYQFTRLEARLSQLFTQRKRDWVRP